MILGILKTKDKHFGYHSKFFGAHVFTLLGLRIIFGRCKVTEDI